MIYRIVVCNGNGPGTDIYGPDAEMAVLNPHLEIELNSAGSLEFTLPVENMNWNVPNVFQNEIEVWEDDKIIWFGRPLQIIRDWNNQRRVVCEGALSYFNDSIQRTWEQQPATNKTNISFFRHLINGHNNDVMNNKNFIADNITIESTPAYRKTDYDTTLDCLQNMCLAVDGGYFILRKEYIWDVVRQKDVAQRYIDWYEELPENAMQDVQFGVNLLDISQDLNGADICTVLIVSGKDDVMLNELGNKNPDTNNGVGHDSGSDEIYYAPGVATYGRIVQQKSWNDYSDINELWRKAKTWMIEKNTDIPTIECSAADLYYINDPDMVVDGPLQVGMKVQVVSAPHDFNKQLLMYKISMDLDSGVKKVTLGTPPKKELTDIVAPSSGGSSTSGGKGAAGGSSESGSGSGCGSQTVIAPVQDVKVKWPDTDVYTSVVKKKTAKIDLTEVGKVLDVKVDGTSVVSNKVANITIPVKGVKQDGSSVVDENGIANIEVPVKDVKVDGQTVVDANGFAQLLSDDFGRVKGVLVNGTSVVNPETGIATLNGYVDGYQVQFNRETHKYYWVQGGSGSWHIQDSDYNQYNTADYNSDTKTLKFDLTSYFQRKIVWGDGIETEFKNLGSEPEKYDGVVEGSYIVKPYWKFDSIKINDYVRYLSAARTKNNPFELKFTGGHGVNVDVNNQGNVKIYLANDANKPNFEYVFSDDTTYDGADVDVDYTIYDNAVYLIQFISSEVDSLTINFYDLNGNMIYPTPYFNEYGSNNSNKVRSEIWLGTLSAGTKIRFSRSNNSSYDVEDVCLRTITKITNVDFSTVTKIKGIDAVRNLTANNETETLWEDLDHPTDHSYYTDIGTISIMGGIAFKTNTDNYSRMYISISKSTVGNQHGDPVWEDPYSVVNYKGNDEDNTEYYRARCNVAYDIGPTQEQVGHCIRNGLIFWLSPGYSVGSVTGYAYFHGVILSVPIYHEEEDGYVTETEMDNAISTAVSDAVSTLESNFQDGVDAIYDACVAKGSTPASQSLSDVVQGIMDIPQSGGGGDTIKFTSSSQENSDFVVVSATSTWDATGLSFTSEVST